MKIGLDRMAPEPEGIDRLPMVTAPDGMLAALADGFALRGQGERPVDQFKRGGGVPTERRDEAADEPIGAGDRNADDDVELLPGSEIEPSVATADLCTNFNQTSASGKRPRPQGKTPASEAVAGGRKDNDFGAADNNEAEAIWRGFRGIIDRAQQCHDRLPEQVVDPASRKAWIRQFGAMWHEPDLGPLAPGISDEANGERHKIFSFGSRLVLGEFIGRCTRLHEENDIVGLRRAMAEVLLQLDRIEPFLEPDGSGEAGEPADTMLDEIIRRAQQVHDSMPERVVSPRTNNAYIKQFQRMWREPVFDPLPPGISRNTYGCRRAALVYCGRRALGEFISRCVRQRNSNDIVGRQGALAELLLQIERIEPALKQHPPLPAGASPFSVPTSQWCQVDQPRLRRGRLSKRSALRELPTDWDERLWDGAPRDWRYRTALAVHLLVPCRPEELVPGKRPHGWSPGVEVGLTSEGVLVITYHPVKAHGGMYGTATVTIEYDAHQRGGPASFLAGLCVAAGGHTIVSLQSTNPMRKALARLGQRLLPEMKQAFTPYVARHQLLADLKATVGAGAEVASAAGQCTDRTQSKYGRVEQGRRLKGFIRVRSTRTPRTGNVERARQLGTERRASLARRLNNNRSRH